MNIPGFFVPFLMIILFFLGTLLGGVLSLWGNLFPPSFFDFKLTTIIQIVITLMLGCYITYFLRLKSGKELKKSEIYIEIITDLQDKLVTASESADLFMKDTNSMDRKKLLNQHKHFSARLSFIEKNAKIDQLDFINSRIETIQDNFKKMRKILTEEIFLEEIAKYPDEMIREYNQLYENTINQIYEMKIDSFN